jgi:hypothetical protein
LNGCLATLQNGGIIKGVILKENEIISIISGKQEFMEPVDEPSPNEPSPNAPNLFIATSIPITGLPVLGSDRIIHVFATGFKFDPTGNNLVRIMIDEQINNQRPKVMQDGTVKFQVKVPEQLSECEHIIKVIQEVDNNMLMVSGTFIKAVIDEID